MKNSKLLSLQGCTIFLFLILTNACKVDTVATAPDPVFKKDSDVTAAINDMYAALARIGNYNGGIFGAQELGSDELMEPQRGTDWYDGNQYIHAQTHQNVSTDLYLNYAWTECYGPIATANLLINHLPTYSASQAATLLPEVRAVRAYFYFQILDIFGNAPIFINNPAGTDEFISKDRTTVYAFVESELKTVLPNLSKTKTYGKMNYWSAQALLSRLYLNAEIYTGKSNFPAAQAAADDVIKNSPYKLENNYYTNFISANENSNENIWVVPYDGVNLKGFTAPISSLDPIEKASTFNLQNQPWNGYCAIQEFYNSYDKTDARAKNFLVGQRYAVNGTTKIDVNYTPEVNELYPSARHDAGARIGKFELKPSTDGNLSNDFPIFRLAEM